MKCPRCQQHNPPHAMFCLQCGAPVRRSARDDASEASYTELQRSLTEALARESAIGEILQVIGSSPTDVQPVFETIARNAVRVCDSTDALVALVEGDETVTRAHYGDQMFGASRRPITRGLVVGRAVLEARPIQVDDLTTAADFPEGRELALR